jgi:pimeloyl-ACP methyl ester carboxylesterase
MSARPAVVLVHGLWHDAWCWERVVPELETAGFDVTAVHLPLTTLDDDVAEVGRALDGLDRPALLVGHSYGGAVVTAAGTHPAVCGLLYIAAYQLDEGESVSRTVPGRELPDTRLRAAMVLDAERGVVGLDPALGPALLYHDADDSVASAAAARLRPVAREVFRGIPRAIAWRAKPSTYLICGADQVVHPARQRAMAERADIRMEWGCGHSPALTRPAELAELIGTVAQRSLRARDEIPEAFGRADRNTGFRSRGDTDH